MKSWKCNELLAFTYSQRILCVIVIVFFMILCGCSKPTNERVSPSTDDTITFRFHTPPDLEGKMYVLSTWFSDSPDCEEKNEVLGIQRSGRFGKVTYSTLHNGTWEIVAPTKLEDPLCKWDFNRFAIGFSDSEAVGKLENTLAHMYLREGDGNTPNISKLECDRDDFDYLNHGARDIHYSIKCRSLLSTVPRSNDLPALIASTVSGAVSIFLIDSGKKTKNIHRVTESETISKRIFLKNGTVSQIEVLAQHVWWKIEHNKSEKYELTYRPDNREEYIMRKSIQLTPELLQTLTVEEHWELPQSLFY